MNFMWLVALSLFGIGLTAFYLIHRYLRYSAKKHAESIAEDIVDQAKDKFEERMDEAKESANDFAESLYDKHANEFEKLEEKIALREENVEALKTDLDSYVKTRKDEYNKRKNIIDHLQNLADAKVAKFKFKREEIENKQNQYVDELAKHHQLDKQAELEALSKKLETEAQVKANQYIEEQEELNHLNAEKNAKAHINIALNRFKRPYCAERGIGFLVMKKPEDADRMRGPDNENMIHLEELCGVDIIYNEKANSLSVSGFDPVRRELARLTIEKLYREHKINKEVIEKTLEKCKAQLFKRIREDGIRIAKELKLKDLSQEVRNMMGALRYRYSFTQNQYFHCAEVGHLCGLLSSEIGGHRADARRAGMLHDIGKAMDHSIDGGHAVIGADFIEKNGEDEKIVHAVRAHHYDEQPSTDLAFLVIGADAISGARPGARRSTAVTYHQKMDQLLEIGNSFEGVIDTFILSAGREARITVDSAKVDDQKALELSKEVATRIEEQCNYPGTIKVTVVRSTQAVEMAK